MPHPSSGGGWAAVILIFTGAISTGGAPSLRLLQGWAAVVPMQRLTFSDKPVPHAFAFPTLSQTTREDGPSARTPDLRLRWKGVGEQVNENREATPGFRFRTSLRMMLLLYPFALIICSACLREVSVSLAPLNMRATSSVRSSPATSRMLVRVRPPDSFFSMT